LPGQDEAELMCKNARRVAELCELLKLGDNWSSSLKTELLQDELEAEGGPPDGAWILPEEF